MNLQYEAFCFADPLFYDEQKGGTSPVGNLVSHLPKPPVGWTVTEQDVWRMLTPSDHRLPGQGWKIHVSATLENASRILTKVADHCIRRGVSFKHLRTLSILLTRNSKYAERAGSGKFIAIYPVDEPMLSMLLGELSEQLEGEPGPYLLSDLRYGAGPLYVRFGGFAERWVDVDGVRVPAIVRPDGALVPDRREPRFLVPDWVQLPSFLEPHRAARGAGDPTQFPYQVRHPLHFSNGGGVYLATSTADGREVVLKEARPHAGLDAHGVDAVTRLEREYTVLRRLAGIPGVPEVYDLVEVWEHRFVVMQRMPGIPLGPWLALNYPFSGRDRVQADLDAYTERVVSVLAQVSALLARIHEQGLFYGDLHAHNILVDIDNGDSVSLVDFELAGPIDGAVRSGLGAPGFRAPVDRIAVEADEYALAALRLWFFLPLNTVLELAPGKLEPMIEFIERRFGLPDRYGDQIRGHLTPRSGPVVTTCAAVREIEAAEPDWGVVRKSIGEAILASATPERTDRLFPGDIEQFRVGGACFGFGAAGVLHALNVAGLGRYPEHEQWLLDSVRRDSPKLPGFMDGACGIAYVLDAFGHQEAADELLAGSAGLLEQTTTHDLNGGLAGIGLTRLGLAGTRDGKESAEQLRLARKVGERLAIALPGAAAPGQAGRAGLLHGWSGPAVLFARLYGHDGDPHWLELADQALARDLQECVVANDGSLQVRDRSRTLPYVGVGSAGIAMASCLLAEYAAQRGDEVGSRYQSLSRLGELLEPCRAEFTVFPGLTYGRAGLLATLAMATRGTASRLPGTDAEAAIGTHLAGLRWYAVPYRNGMAFAGNYLLRLSMDVNTGGAGILLALAAHQDGHGTALPFLEPPSP